jgi:phosphotransferase system  glucose/maltose/N-acetylglucosamine-specific IIC component
MLKLNKDAGWLDQPVGKAEKILLVVTAVIVAVSILMMIAKWI